MNLKCVVCSEEKPIEEFYIRSDGYQYKICRACQSKERRVYSKTPAYLAYRRAWSKANPEKRAEINRRYRAKNKGNNE